MFGNVIKWPVNHDSIFPMKHQIRASDNSTKDCLDYVLFCYRNVYTRTLGIDRMKLSLYLHS